MTTPLWVVVPAYNEAARIGDTLAALAGQTDTDFTLLVVDNGSTDATAELARAFRGPFRTEVLVEPEKGVGCAVDTGFRHAIAAGAVQLARTDADCLPTPGWVAAARTALAESCAAAGARSSGRHGAPGQTAGSATAGARSSGRRGAPGQTAGSATADAWSSGRHPEPGHIAGLACGRIVARRDEHGPAGRAFFRVLVGLAAAFGRLRPAHRGAGYLAPYRMHAGNNMAITAELYQACGGMPRRPSPTDRTFLNRVRRTTPAIVRSRDMVVANSTRRLRAYGVLGTARWYLGRGSGGRTADPR